MSYTRTFIYAFLFVIQPVIAQQTIQLVNDDSLNRSDDDIWVLFVGSPASVTSSGTKISGFRNLELPSGIINTPQTAPSDPFPATNTVQSDTFMSPALSQALPAPPFPLLFISGQNANIQVQVIAFDGVTGTFTLEQDSTLGNKAVWPLQAQAVGDQFEMGAYSQPLSSFHKVGTTTSTLSGQVPNVYSVSAELASGIVYISYAQITYLNAAPTISDSIFAFQTIELTTAKNVGDTTSDLTVIDYFGIPLQIESVNSVNAIVDDFRTFNFKKSTIATGIEAIGASKLQNGMYLEPGQQAAANSGDPNPFPSFSDYLGSLSLVNDFAIEGSQNFGAANPKIVYGINVAQNYDTTYGFNSFVTEVSSGSGNFRVVMDPIKEKNTIKPAPGSQDSNLNYFPDINNIDNVTVELDKDTLNQTIYGAVLDANSFTINLKSGSPSLTPTTLSGPFTISTEGDANSFTASDLIPLETASLGGLTLSMTSGTQKGKQSVIQSVQDTGMVVLNTALANSPSAGDSFEILLSVTSASAHNTNSNFGATALGNLNFLPPLAIEFRSGNNNGSKSQAAKIDSAGNISLQQPLANTPVAGDLFAVIVSSDDLFTQLYTNSVFSWVVANFLAGMNFGFIDSPIVGDSSANWFSQFPQKFPFGLTRVTPDDGYYNPWAAYFYNASNTYGFAFSDRVSPSPLLVTDPSSQDLWITVLPEDQVDAPLVEYSPPTQSTIDLSWAPETAVDYSITTFPTIPANQITINSTAGTANISGLPAGMAYEIQVQGKKGAQESRILPVFISTTGSLIPTIGNAPFGFSFTWAGTSNLDTSLYSILLNGSEFALSGTYHNNR